MSERSLRTALVVCVATLSACGESDGAAIDLAAPAVIEVTPLPDEVFTFAPLSDDGALLAYPTSREVCVLQIETGSTRCVETAPSPWPQSFRFAPDSARLLFVDDFVRQLSEPDVQVLDLATMEITNLTDDGIDTVGFGDDAPTALIDLAAAWMPDGSVVFVRSSGIEGDPVLMRLAADDTEPTEVSDLGGIDSVELVFPLQPIGTDAVAGVTVPASGAAALVRIDLATGDTATIATFPESDGRVELIDVAGETGVALVAYTDAIAAMRADRPFHALVDLESGTVTPLLDGVTDDDLDPIVTEVAAITPDGTGIVFGRAEFDRLGLYTVAIEAALGTVAGDDITRVGELPASVDGVDLLGWNPAVPLVWVDGTTLVGRVGLDAVATVTFAEPG